MPGTEGTEMKKASLTFCSSWNEGERHEQIVLISQRKLLICGTKSAYVNVRKRHRCALEVQRRLPGEDSSAKTASQARNGGKGAQAEQDEMIWEESNSTLVESQCSEGGAGGDGG